MRLLHERHGDDRGGPSEGGRAADRRPASGRARRQPLPLRHAPSRPAGSAPRSASCDMNRARRAFLGRSGALVVSFVLPIEALAQAGLPPTQDLDAWLAIATDGHVTAFCGKVELGTGIETAITQLVAEELEVAVGQVSLVMGDTERCPDQGPTVGSRTLQGAGPQIRQAAADARQTLLNMAAVRLGVPVVALAAKDGVVTGPGGRRVSYAELVGGGR